MFDLPLLFATVNLPTFASRSLDSLAVSRTRFEFCRQYSRTPFHRDSIAMHCPIETPDSLNHPYYVIFCDQIHVLRSPFRAQNYFRIDCTHIQADRIENRFQSKAIATALIPTTSIHCILLYHQATLAPCDTRIYGFGRLRFTAFTANSFSSFFVVICA